MFASIAPRYDLNNRIHSFGMDQAWRRAAVRLAAPQRGDEVLDVACGTGDLTRLFARSEAASVVGADFCSEMLEVAAAKTRPEHSRAVDTADRRSEHRIAPVRYIEADAMELPFEDHSFDIVSIAFGIRNVADPSRAIREFARVLRPGGRLVILEFARPKNPLVAMVNAIYCARIMPWTATLISRDRSGAYRYLPRSIDTFLDPESLAQLLRVAGFSEVSRRALTLGVCVCHRGVARHDDRYRP